MNPTVLTIALIVLGLVSGRWLMRRFPVVRKAQVFSATIAWFGGILITARPGGSQFWHYTGLVIAIVMGSFLMLALLRRWDTPRTSGPA